MAELHIISRELSVAVAASALLLGPSSAGCGSAEPASTAPQVDVAALPTLGHTQQDMLDLILAAQTELQRVAPDTAPWKWFSDYTITECVGGRIDGASAMSLPDLASSGPVSADQWAAIYSAVEKIAGDAGLTEYRGPNDDGDMHAVEFGSSDGRTLGLSATDSVVLTAEISCRRNGDVTFGLDNAVLMPPDPQ